MKDDLIPLLDEEKISPELRRVPGTVYPDMKQQRIILAEGLLRGMTPYEACKFSHYKASTSNASSIITRIKTVCPEFAEYLRIREEEIQRQLRAKTDTTKEALLDYHVGLRNECRSKGELRVTRECNIDIAKMLGYMDSDGSKINIINTSGIKNLQELLDMAERKRVEMAKALRN
jgi:hypothetical protein